MPVGARPHPDPNDVNGANDNEDDDDDLTCGIGNWRPKWMQPLANPKIFLLNFSIIAVIQGKTIGISPPL